MIEVSQLVKKYGEFTAIDNISFVAPRGSIVGLLGPNGAGKSTTMKILSCFMPASSGTAKVAGYDVFDDPMEVKKRVGYCPEVPPLYPEMRIGEYLRYVAALKKVPAAKVGERVDFVASRCGLSASMKKVIGTLSKGFKQRVGIAQALVHDPEVVILDEPTVGLDPVQIIEIRELIKSLKGTHTVILSTHILPEVTMTCDKVVMINRGRILVDKTLSELTSGNGESLEKVYVNLISQDIHTAQATV